MEKKNGILIESYTPVLLTRETDARKTLPFSLTKMSPYGQASLRGNLCSRPGLFPFPRVRRDGRDVSALTMDFTHSIAIARIVFPASIVSVSHLSLLARDFLDPFLSLFFRCRQRRVPIFCTPKPTDGRRTTGSCAN